MVMVWENLREFLNGMQRFRDNLDKDDFDGSVSRKELEKRRQEAEDKKVTTCWVKPTWRSFGSFPDACPSGKEVGKAESEKPAAILPKDKSFYDDSATEEDGLLCYPPCKEKYGGLGPLCWTSCPAGFKNHGLWCYKPDGHWPRCDDNTFHKQAGLWCSKNCPDDMVDIGISCQKGNYWRGIGSIRGCSGGRALDGLFCYEQCKPGFEGFGSICFSVCGEGTDSCGPALCIADDDDESCSSKIFSMVKGVVKLALQTAKTITKSFSTEIGGGGETSNNNLGDQFVAVEESVGNFLYPFCKIHGLSRKEKKAIEK